MTENIELIARKSNDLIQNFECPFTAQQQKICMYLVAQLKPWDEGFQPLEVSVKDFCLACGIDEPGGRSYKHLEKAIQDFGFKWIKRQNGKKEALIWFKYVKIENGKITFLFNEMMTPYILYLQNKLSEVGKDFAFALGIEVQENHKLQKGSFPTIKCNISKDGEKIYHLPFDQQYRKTLIDKPGEFMAFTVKEAEDKGFRRAFRNTKVSRIRAFRQSSSKQHDQ